MTYLAAFDWNAVTAFLTLGLVVAAFVAAYYAKQDIKTQLRTSEDALKTQLQVSKDSLDTQLRTSEKALETQLKTSKESLESARARSAEELQATREATQAAQDAVQRQLEAADRPLLIDVSEHTSGKSDLDPQNHVELHFPGDHVERAKDWRLACIGYDTNEIWVAVPLRNVGRGPAIIDPGRCHLMEEDGIGQRRDCVVHRERVPPGETTRILCTHSITTPAPPDDLRMRTYYTDFAGAQSIFADVHLKRLPSGAWRVVSVKPAAP